MIKFYSENIGYRSEKNTVKLLTLSAKFFSITLCLSIVSLVATFQVAHSQTNRLSLAQVLTGLQSKSGGFTLAQKNIFITKRVREKGVTFKLTPEIRKELQTAGASNALIRMISLKTPRTFKPPTTEEAKPRAVNKKISFERNAVVDGKRGLKIIANFNVYNLKGVKSDIVFRFKKGNRYITSSNKSFSTKAGHLSARRYLTPAHSATVYEELEVFIPYKEFNLGYGNHNLQLVSYVIYRDGKIVSHLGNQNFRLNIPSPTIRKTGTARLSRMWMDYNVTEDGVKGMRVNVKMSVSGMRNRDAYLQVLFTKKDGTKLYTSNQTYRSPSGQLALYRNLRPRSASASYNNLSMFIPYSEIKVSKGKHTLSVHADVVYTDYSLLKHLDIKSFSFSR